MGHPDFVVLRHTSGRYALFSDRSRERYERPFTVKPVGWVHRVPGTLLFPPKVIPFLSHAL